MAPGPIGAVTPSSVAATTLSSTGLATLQSARITGLTPNQIISTDGSNNLISGGTTPGISISKTFWQIESTKEVGAAFALQMATTFTSIPIYGYQYFQNAPAINDQWSQTFSMAAGSYALSAIGLTATNRGIISWYVDGVLQGTMDYYANPGLTNTIKSISVTILTTGTHTIRGILASKNASSTDYFCTIQQFWLKQ